MAIAQTPPRADETALLAEAAQQAFRWRALALVVDVLVLFCGGFYYFDRPPLVIASKINTGFFDEHVNSYTLGSPTRTAASITYLIRYTSAQHPSGCSGTITLNWEGIYGWEVASAVTTCK